MWNDAWEHETLKKLVSNEITMLYAQSTLTIMALGCLGAIWQALTFRRREFLGLQWYALVFHGVMNYMRLTYYQQIKGLKHDNDKLGLYFMGIHGALTILNYAFGSDDRVTKDDKKND